MALSPTYVVIAFLCAGASSFSVGPQDLDLNLNHEATQQVMSLLGIARRRVTREVDIVHPKKCCGKEKIVISDDDNKMMQECDPHAKENGGMTACWMECMAKKKNTLDAENNVVVQSFTKVYMTHYVDESLKSSTEDAIKKCAEMMNKKASELGPEEYKGNKCNRAALLTSFCVRYLVETGCPKEEMIEAEAFQNCYEQWKQLRRLYVAAQGNYFEGDDCNKLREDMKTWKDKI